MKVNEKGRLVENDAVQIKTTQSNARRKLSDNVDPAVTDPTSPLRILDEDQVNVSTGSFIADQLSTTNYEAERRAKIEAIKARLSKDGGKIDSTLLAQKIIEGLDDIISAGPGLEPINGDGKE